MAASLNIFRLSRTSEDVPSPAISRPPGISVLVCSAFSLDLGVMSSLLPLGVDRGELRELRPLWLPLPLFAPLFLLVSLLLFDELLFLLFFFPTLPKPMGSLILALV